MSSQNKSPVKVIIPQDDEKKTPSLTSPKITSPRKTSTIPLANLKALAATELGKNLKARKELRNERKPLRQIIADRINDYSAAFAESDDQLSCEATVALLRNLDNADERTNSAILTVMQMQDENESKSHDWWMEIGTEEEVAGICADFLVFGCEIRDEDRILEEKTAKLNEYVARTAQVLLDIGELHATKATDATATFAEIASIKEGLHINPDGLEEFSAIEERTLVLQARVNNYNATIGVSSYVHSTTCPPDVADNIKASTAKFIERVNSLVERAIANSASANMLKQANTNAIAEINLKKYEYTPPISHEEQQRRVREKNAAALAKHHERTHSKK